MTKFDIINKHLEKKIMKQSVALINAYKGLDNDIGSSLMKLTSDHPKPTPAKINNLFILDPPTSIFSSSPSSYQMMTMMSTDQKNGIKPLASNKAP